MKTSPTPHADNPDPRQVAEQLQAQHDYHQDDIDQCQIRVIEYRRKTILNATSIAKLGVYVETRKAV